MDNETIIEFWEKMSPFVASSEKVNAAIALIEFLDDNGLSFHLEHALDLPKALHAAVVSHYDIDDDDAEESEERW